MKLHRVVVAVAASAAVVVGGTGCGTAQGGQAGGPSTVSETTSPADTASPSTEPSTEPTKEPTKDPESDDPAPTSDLDPDDQLDGENLIRERLYFDVTRHSLMGDKQEKAKALSVCTGDKSFADVLPSGVMILSYTIEGNNDGTKVVSQVAESGSPEDAQTSMNKIVKLMDDCEGIQAGDFGYGDPVTVASDAKHKIVYLPAFNSNDPAGGYIVVRAGSRVAVLDVNDNVSKGKVAHLAKEIYTTTAM